MAIGWEWGFGKIGNHSLGEFAGLGVVGERDGEEFPSDIDFAECFEYIP